MNKTWHLANKMPEKPTNQQRALWHIEHLKNCDCRKPTPNIQNLVDSYLLENKKQIAKNNRGT